MIVPAHYHSRLRKARSLATDLRCLLEEVFDEVKQGTHQDLADDVEDQSINAGAVESFLDDLDLGDS